MASDDWTKFPPVNPPSLATRQPKATLIGVMGPPGSGKTRTILRLMRGAQRVFPGPAVLIDTEAGRSSTYAPRKGSAPNPDDPAEPTYDFQRIDLGPPYRGDRCWAAIKLALELKPAAVGFDNISDEHSGEGGYLDWHDQEVERVGGNEWGAWSRPSAARKKLISGIIHVPPPPLLFFSFIAEEKTDQITVKDERTGRDKKKVIQKGWTPVAPLLILKTLDLTCILPWDSKGTPIWESRKLPFEDFIRKWPDHLTRLMAPGQITEDHGEALAKWAKGDAAPAGDRPAAGQPGEKATILGEVQAALQALPTKETRADALQRHWLVSGWTPCSKLSAEALAAGLESLRREQAGIAEMKAEPLEREREPGEEE